MDIEILRKICLSLPGATEDIKWEADLCFLIGGKMFCVTGFEPGSSVTLKVPDPEFEEMIAGPGFSPAPYLARAKWVQVEDLDQLSKEEWSRLIQQSYELVKSKLPKKVLKEMGL
jgi:predicted DNA-binding protein (MmcQ/YjbR family)